MNSDYQTRRAVEEASSQWFAQLNRMREHMARSEPVQHADMTAYIQRRTAEERDNIAPELVDYISGSTVDEVEQSITTAKAKTQSILEGLQMAQQQLQVPPAQPIPQPQQHTAATGSVITGH